MYHSKTTSSFIIILVNSLLISLFLTPCSSFLYLNQDIQISSFKNIKTVEQINIYTYVTGDFVVGSEITVSAKLDKDVNKTLDVELVCEGEKCVKILGETNFGEKSFINGSSKQIVKWNLKLKDNGLAKLIVKPTNLNELDDDIELGNAYSSKLLKIGKSHALNTIAIIVGYIYFVAWMISLYPIVITNFNRKSVIGLNLDFVALNTTGYLSYAIYNVCLFLFADFQEVYFEKFKGSQIPVELNDVLFATHGFVVNCLICIQCIFYERGNQSLTNIAKGILLSVYSPAIVLTLFYYWDGVNKYYYITFFSYAKLLLTLCKYVPQAYFNYKRQSTKGWSVYYCLLDFTGGSFSILQMILNSINQDDYRNFTGNAGKLGLGLVSILFDILFMVQHYVLYAHTNQPILENQVHDYGSSSSKQQSPIKNSKNGITNPSFSRSFEDK